MSVGIYRSKYSETRGIKVYFLPFVLIACMSVSSAVDVEDNDHIINLSNLTAGFVSSNATNSLETTDDNEFPQIPICKWAIVSNWFFAFHADSESPSWRELMEMVDDADELSGDISRPGAAEMILREAVHHFSQVCFHSAFPMNTKVNVPGQDLSLKNTYQNEMSTNIRVLATT